MKHVALLLVLAVCALAQPPQTATIAGRVTDANGKPLAGATLQLSAIGRGRGRGPDSPSTATSAIDGTYSFTNIEPGQHMLRAIRAGYISADVPAVDLNHTDVSLTAAGSISGKVTDENGDPVSGVVLQIWHQPRSRDGGTHLISEQERAATDNSGQYKIPNVQPGTFSLSANGFQVTGIPDTQLFDIVGLRVYRPPNPIFPAPPRPGQRTQAYLTTWFRSPVEVAPGRDVSGIDIQLHKTPLYRLSGRVVNLAEPAGIMVMTSSGRSLNGQPENIANDGSFQQSGLLPGDYFLGIYGTTMANRGFFALQKFTIADNDIDALNIQVPPPAEVLGSLTLDGKPPAQPLIISLNGVDLPPFLAASGQVKTEFDGSFAIPRAIPGPTHIEGLPPNTYMSSVLLNGTEVGESAFNLPPGPSTLRIALMTANGQIHLRASPDDRGAIATFAVIVPEPGTRGATWPYKEIGSASRGVFIIARIPPGAYRIYALRGVDRDTLTPDILKEYESQSVKVEVTGSDPLEATAQTIAVP